MTQSIQNGLVFLPIINNQFSVTFEALTLPSRSFRTHIKCLMSHDWLNSYVSHKYQVVTYASNTTMGPYDPYLGLNLIEMLTKDVHKTQNNTLSIYLL